MLVPFTFMKEQILIVGVVLSGTPLPMLDFEVRNLGGGEWGQSFFGLRYSPIHQLSYIYEDVMDGKNLFIRTSIIGERVLQKYALSEDLKMHSVLILPDDMKTLYRGKITPEQELLRQRELAFVEQRNLPLKRIIFENAQSCAEKLLHEWHVVHEILV